MSYGKRKDENQNAVVAELKKYMPEVSVFDASHAGDGFPDLVIGYRGHTFLCEVKNPEKCESARRLTPAQVKFHGAWKGHVMVADSACHIAAQIAKFFNELHTQ